jgi:hypothetical protein
VVENGATEGWAKWIEGAKRMVEDLERGQRAEPEGVGGRRGDGGKEGVMWIAPCSFPFRNSVLLSDYVERPIFT